MLRDDFAKAIEELVKYFVRRDDLSEETMLLWFREVERVPTEALDFILRKIKLENQRWPSNIPADFKRLGREWWHAHPEKRTARKQVECQSEYCIDGMLFTVNPQTGRAGPACRCGSCRNSDLYGVPMAKPKDLLGLGWELKLRRPRLRSTNPLSPFRMLIATHQQRQGIDEVPF